MKSSINNKVIYEIVSPSIMLESAIKVYLNRGYSVDYIKKKFNLLLEKIK